MLLFLNIYVDFLRRGSDKKKEKKIVIINVLTILKI